MEPAAGFQPYTAEHVIVLLLTLALPFILAGWVRLVRSAVVERAIAIAISVVLAGNYAVFLTFVRPLSELAWYEMLPMHMCDWAMIVIIVAILSGHHRSFEVAYFWGIGGTLQAVLTPNLRYGFPDLRFICFFVSHCGIIVGVAFLMLTRRLRPYPISILRVFAWSELYFVVALLVDELTGVNYGFLLHKPQAFSLLSYLSDSRPIYLLQMHGLALVFFVALYLPFAMADLLKTSASHKPQNGTRRRKGQDPL